MRDLTGRFPKRPHYESSELDAACADLAHDILRTRHGDTVYPITTDDLSVLIEQRAADLDLFSDLSSEGDDVEGVTDFSPGEPPRVRISARLTENPRRVARLRTTLAHELAHVEFHNFIWWFDQGTLDAERAAALSPRCHRRRIAGVTDWMEWQANYASGALLMPADALAALFPADGAWLRSEAGRARIRRVEKTFEVSAPAASLRLQQLGYVSQRPRLIARSPIPR